MAALTAASVRSFSLGDRRLIRVRFTTADDADTWASGSTGIDSYWTQDRTNPATQASAGVAATESAGTFTFHPAEDGVAFDLFYILGGA